MDIDRTSSVQTTILSSSMVDQDARHFVLADYLVFGGMLAVSTLIGIYFAIKDKFSSSTGEFLTGSGNLGVVPVALSMLASFLSSITLIGQPAEAFLFGPQLWIFGISCFAVVPIVGYIFAPFFQEKKYMSAYEYFGERFSKSLQLIASFLFTIQMVLYLALVLYAPALAVHQVTGVNTLLIVSVMYLVCIFYTTIGGMKAVVWTDTFQVVVLYSAMFTILIKGTVDIGGLSTVWDINAKYNRTILFDWNPDPTVRYNAWSAFFGSAFLHISFYGGNQLQIQRYLTVKTASQARKMLWINTVGWTIVVLLTVYAGLLIFAFYSTCNPIISQKVLTPDEIFPLYVMETLHDFPGFPGLFLAGVFSAGLSTVSAGINSLAAIWINEVRGTSFSSEIAIEKRSDAWVKILSLFFGVLSFLLVFLVPYLGGLTPVAISLSGIFTGSLFGVFCLGMFIPVSNNAGATTGLIVSVALLTWMATGNIIFSRPPVESYLQLDVPTHGCANFTATPTSFVTTRFDDGNAESNFYLYRISYLWYPMLACLFTVVIGYVVSILTDKFNRSTIRINSNNNNNANIVANENRSYRRNNSIVTNRRSIEDEIALTGRDTELRRPFVDK